jgi:hypothetical protein
MNPGEPSERELDDARTLQRDLADAFTAAQHPSDADCLDEVRRICELTRIAINDEQCHAILQQIERYAECFFLTDDEIPWTWHTSEAYAGLRGLLQRLAKALELRLTCLEARRRSLEVSGSNEVARPRPATARFASVAPGTTTRASSTRSSRA